MRRKKCVVHEPEYPEMLERFSGRVLEQLRSSQLTQVELAERIGVSPKNLNGILRGRHWLSMPLYINICRVFGVNSGALLEPRK